MLRTFVSGKIHRLRVSALNPMYNGSCLICPDLLAAAGIQPFRVRTRIYSLTSVLCRASLMFYVFPRGGERRVRPERWSGGSISESAIKWPLLHIVARNTSAALNV